MSEAQRIAEIIISLNEKNYPHGKSNKTVREEIGRYPFKGGMDLTLEYGYRPDFSTTPLETLPLDNPEQVMGESVILKPAEKDTVDMSKVVNEKVKKYGVSFFNEAKPVGESKADQLSQPEIISNNKTRQIRKPTYAGASGGRGNVSGVGKQALEGWRIFKDECKKYPWAKNSKGNFNRICSLIYELEKEIADDDNINFKAGGVVERLSILPDDVPAEDVIDVIKGLRKELHDKHKGFRPYSTKEKKRKIKDKKKKRSKKK